MKLGLLLLVFLCVLFVAPSAWADEPSDDDSDFEEDGSEEALASEVPGGCPVHCSPYEACVEQRCVEMCRTGCRPGTFCTVDGECEPLPEPREAILTEADRQRLSGAESADEKLFLFADVGGAIGFGISLGLEYGEYDSFIARVRALNAGVMSHAAFAENEFQRLDWGFGGNVAYRHYESNWGNLRGFYYGGGLDYSVTRVVDRVNPAISQLFHSAAPFGEFGYRWVFRKMAIGFGPTIGLRYPIGTWFSSSNQLRCSPGEGSERCDDANSRRFEGVMHLEIGWYR